MKTGLLEVVALARLAVLDAVAGFAEGTLDTRQKARIAVLERERQLLLRSCASRTRG